jgi:hypothetical protein
MGLAELFTFALVPALVFPMLSPSIGEQYALADALVHGLCVFVGASTLFALALLLSTVFDDLWRPLLITCLVGMLLALGEMATPELHGLFTVMSGEAYFESGSLPWAGLLIVAVVTAALLYGAAANLERRDF